MAIVPLTTITSTTQQTTTAREAGCLAKQVRGRRRLRRRRSRGRSRARQRCSQRRYEGHIDKEGGSTSGIHQSQDSRSDPPSSFLRALLQQQIAQLISPSTEIFKPERQPQASEKFMLIFTGVQFKFWITADGDISRSR